jgi:hypothetical protein
MPNIIKIEQVQHAHLGQKGQICMTDFVVGQLLHAPSGVDVGTLICVKCKGLAAGLAAGDRQGDLQRSVHMFYAVRFTCSMQFVPRA